ncbi:hypothetical protein F5879DRAFT_493580 [Lentinula edodes]|nr:hypothetical protein F5879DRAFT_493580 [Lentinula edodes]
MLGSASLFGLLSAVLYTSFSPVPVDALNNGVGKLPALGYNTWNAYGVRFLPFTGAPLKFPAREKEWEISGKKSHLTIQSISPISA